MLNEQESREIVAKHAETCEIMRNNANCEHIWLIAIKSIENEQIDLNQLKSI